MIGVKDDGTAVGLTKDKALSFTQDGVAAIVNDFAAPYAEVTVTVGCHPTENSLWFVVVQVKEFEEIAVLCRKDGSDLRQGAIYVRGRRINETTEIRTEAEMREVLDMAVEKGIRAFYHRIDAAGLEVTPRVSHQQQFETQLGGL